MRAEARAAQIRTPISDEPFDEAWVWRYKDIRNWWLHAHHERVGGVRQADPTGWIPQSKPIRFTEFGCAAIDKGTNQPNKFLDPKSSESQLPYFSNGRQDELMQLQYLRAVVAFWTDPDNNPRSEEYDGAMLNFDRSCVWAWDARPYPWFPANRGIWSDGANYARGHWLTGRASARSLASVVDEICARADVAHFETSGLYAHVRGYVVEDIAESRGALQPLMLRYGCDAIERAGQLTFRQRDGAADVEISNETLVRDPDRDGVVETRRSGEVELAGRVRLRFVEADGDYEVIAEEAILPDENSQTVSVSELPLAMTRAEGRQTVERWLSESRVARDSVRLTLPPSQMKYGAGDVVSLPEIGGRGHYRIDRVEQIGLAQRAELVRIEAESYVPLDVGEIPASVAIFAGPVPLTPVFLDLPLLTGDEVPHAPYLAVTANPWQGSAALFSSTDDADYRLNTLIETPSVMGITETPMLPACPGRFDRGTPLRVRMLNGHLQSVTEAAFLNGANLCAIGDGSPGNWELFQFRDAELVAPDTYALHTRLRGQLGTEAAQRDPWPKGSVLVRIDQTTQQITLSETALGLERFYRVGPGDRPVSDPSYQQSLQIFQGLGLRPYSPVHLSASRRADGAIDFSWIRRTRIGGDRWDRPEVPLSEETEQYLLRVLIGQDVVREMIVQESNWRYEAAAQAADQVLGLFRFDVAQVSAVFGPGPATEITVTV